MYGISGKGQLQEFFHGSADIAAFLPVKKTQCVYCSGRAAYEKTSSEFVGTLESRRSPMKVIPIPKHAIL